MQSSTVNCPGEICGGIITPTTPDTTTTTTTATTPPTNPGETTPEPATPKPPVTTPPVNDVDPNFCVGKTDGLHVNPLNANKFYICASGVTHSLKCGEGLVFQACCNWP